MSGFFDAIRRRLEYVVSLPERTIRSLVAVAGGTTSLLTETLFPEMLRDTTLYRIFLGDTQRFMIEKIAQVQQEQPGGDPDAASDPQYVQKKMIGGALETAGLFAMHFSPLWVFAIAGDAAAGSTVFLDRLIEQLKQNGVLPPDAQVRGLADLLSAIQDTARKSASAIDTPPLSRQDITQLANDMTASYGQMFSNAANLMPRLESIWRQMEHIASRDNVSLEKLGGILTLDVALWGKKGIGAVLALGQTGTDLFGEKILDSYGRTLNVITRDGVTGYLDHHMKPFFKAALSHFDPDRKTWTASLANKVFGGTEPQNDAPKTNEQDASKAQTELPQPPAPPNVENDH